MQHISSADKALRSLRVVWKEVCFDPRQLPSVSGWAQARHARYFRFSYIMWCHMRVIVKATRVGQSGLAPGHQYGTSEELSLRSVRRRHQLPARAIRLWRAAEEQAGHWAWTTVHQTNARSMLFQCWVSVADVDPTLKQHLGQYIVFIGGISSPNHQRFTRSAPTEH